LVGCDEKKHIKYNKFMFNNVVCVRNIDKFSIFNILVNVLEEDEYSIESNNSNVKYDTI